MSSGAVPFQEANRPLSAKRPMSPSKRAAPDGPMRQRYFELGRPLERYRALISALRAAGLQS